MRKKLVQILGWYGVTAILVAYFANSFELLNLHGGAYQWLNLTGAAGLMIETAVKRDRPPLLLNAVWFFIAAFSLARVAMG
jgi:hypothetical protein